MSRFEENVSEAIEEAVRSQSMQAEQLAARIAELVRSNRRPQGRGFDQCPQTMPAPVSGIENQEIYNLLGTAVASPEGTRTVTRCRRRA